MTKTIVFPLCTVLAWLLGVHQVAAQTAAFFQVVGSNSVTITALNPDGTLVFSNAQPGQTYTVLTSGTLSNRTNWADYVQIQPTNAVSTTELIDFHPPAGMVLIPAGSFIMGDTDDHYPQPDALAIGVTVSAFHLDVYPVTGGLWQPVYNWATNHGYTFDNAGSAAATNYPIRGLNWCDCVKWCNARSEVEGLTPAYYTDTNQTLVYRTGDASPSSQEVNWHAGYRLPTEAEWEKAARGGLEGLRFPFGNTISEGQANYDGCTDCGEAYDLGPNGENAAFKTTGTSPVGYFPPNGYGLYDMAGNVEEWCYDAYGTPYAGGTDPRGPAYNGLNVLRGGAYGTIAQSAQCFFRTYYEPNLPASLYGFRCARGN